MIPVQRRWEDYSGNSNAKVISDGVLVHPCRTEFQKWYSYYVQGGQTAMVRELDRRKLENRPFRFDAPEPPTALESILNAG